MNRQIKKTAFTLAELLIALAILGVIATFTIPKVLIAQQNSTSNAIAKETIAAVSAAYRVYQLERQPSGSTNLTDLTPYLNYVSVDTTSLVDNHETNSTPVDCASAICLKLHNGAILYGWSTTFAGTSATNAIYYYIDPDGVDGGSTTGPSKALVMFLYFNGKTTNYGNILPGTTSSYGVHTVCPGCDPTWFSWN
jgi:prepilin-type N-terminal cleavage/methylation domain-containing protein